jgi:hypothetical protein
MLVSPSLRTGPSKFRATNHSCEQNKKNRFRKKKKKKKKKKKALTMSQLLPLGKEKRNERPDRLISIRDAWYECAWNDDEHLGMMMNSFEALSWRVI